MRIIPCYFADILEVELKWSLNWSSLSVFNSVTLFQSKKSRKSSYCTAATFTAHIIDAKAQKQLNSASNFEVPVLCT